MGVGRLKKYQTQISAQANTALACVVPGMTPQAVRFNTSTGKTAVLSSRFRQPPFDGSPLVSLSPHRASTPHLHTPPRYRIEQINPLTMQLSKRFDVVVKTVYASFALAPSPVPRFVEAMYLRHLKVWNDVKERCTFPGDKGWFDANKPCTEKANAADFQRSFLSTLKSIRSDGFDTSISLLPLTPDDFPLNGAHRIGAAIALGLPSIPVQRVPQNGTYDWGASFFQGKGMETEYTDFAMLEWTLRVPHMSTLILWPQAAAMVPKLAQTRKLVAAELGSILYEKHVTLTRNGLSELVFHAYGQQLWLAAKVSDLVGLETVLNVRVLFVLTPRFSVLRAMAAKEHVRTHYGIAKSSVHVSDSNREAALIAETVLNPNSRMYLDTHNGSACSVVAQEIAVRFALTPVKPSLYMLPQTIMVDSGAVMAYFGLRPRTDVDVLFAGAADSSILGKRNGISVEPHTFATTDLGTNVWAWGRRHWGQEHFVGPCKDAADLFNDPSNYGYCHGLKFVSLPQLARYKTKRGEPGKDDRDVALIQTVLGLKPSLAPPTPSTSRVSPGRRDGRYAEQARPEYGTRGISHPRSGRVPAGAPPTTRPLLAFRADGGVV